MAHRPFVNENAGGTGVASSHVSREKSVRSEYDEILDRQ